MPPPEALVELLLLTLILILVLPSLLIMVLLMLPESVGIDWPLTLMELDELPEPSED